jgi:hypothetical protein
VILFLFSEIVGTMLGVFAYDSALTSTGAPSCLRRKSRCQCFLGWDSSKTTCSLVIK